MAENLGRREYFLQLVNTRTKRPIEDDTGDYQVYQPGVPDRQVIYGTAGAQLTQEVVGTSFLSRDMTDGQIHFFTNNSASSVDVTVLTAGGRAYFLKGLTPSQHRVDVNPEKAENVLVVALNDKASATTVRPLGFQLRKGMMIEDVWLRVTAAFAGAAAASNQYDIGRSGDFDGFLDDITVSAVSYVQGQPEISSTGVVRAVKYGNDLAEFRASTTGSLFFYVRKNYIAKTAVASNNLVAKRNSGNVLTHSFTAGGVSGAGKAYIYYKYTLDPTLGEED